MGRIDDALKHARSDSPATVPAHQPEASDVFSDPWHFADHQTPGERPSETPTAIAVDPATVAQPAPTASIFRPGRLKPETAERLVTAPTAPGQLVEQYRRLAATLHHAQLVNDIRILLVTSALPGDGKTMTSTNLALTLSESYRRQVLLIDADLRRPSLHRTFEVPNVGGLNEGLKADRDAKLPVVRISENLTLLPAGRPDPDPMGSLTSDRMRMILEEASRRFDWVIVDTAPVGLLIDASILASMAHATLMVVRANKTSAGAVTKAIEAVGRDRILGVVLNGAENQPVDYGSYARDTSAPPRLPGNS